MSRHTATKAGAGALHMRAYVERHQAGLARLPSPWAWLGVQGAQALVQQAYRTATWCARHEDAADLSELELRQVFVLALANDFKVLLMDAASKAGCAPAWSGEFDQDAQETLAEVPAAWRPEYPQYGKRASFVTGTNSPIGGMGAVAPMVTGSSE